MLRNIYGILSVVLLSFTFSSAHAAPLSDLPGAIPLGYKKQAASDLMYKGQLLLPDEARQLFEDGKIESISHLQPAEDTILWKDTKGEITSAGENTVQSSGDVLEVVETIPSEETLIGQFGVRVLKDFPNGERKIYRLLFDPKAHNILLRKAILEKLGYKVPETKAVSKITLKFKGAFSKNEMVKALNKGTFLESERWVVGTPDEESAELVVQDVIAIENAEDEYYNLAIGVIPNERIRGRRILNSLLLPFNLVDTPESVNLMNWHSGRVFNDQLLLDYEYAKEFDPSYEDALWMARRILELNKQDWEQIVEAGKFPEEVSYLLTQKIISRRNFLRDALNLKEEFKELTFQEDPSFGKRLKKGKLIGGAEWSGYASHFAGTDPDEPLSAPEIWALVQSKGMSNVIASLIREFNLRYVPRTDMGFKMFDHQLDVAAREFARFIQTGETRKVPFGFWKTTYYDANVITNREVVAGNYLGAENIVQLADTIGFAVQAGYYIGADGLPVKVSFDGRAKLNLYRTYTHLKPIKSIKASLKEPFQNMLVPLMKMQDAKSLIALEELGRGRKSMKDEDAVKRAEELLKTFKEELEVGESFIIQMGIGPELAGNVGYGFNENVSAYFSLKDQISVLSRLHIFRKSETEVQVYRDPALFNLVDASIGLRARIQILELGWSWKIGMAQTEFFNLDLKVNALDEKPFESNPQIFDNAGALARVLRWGRLDKLRTLQKPWKITHNFNENAFRFDFLWWRFLQGSVKDDIQVTHPEGAKKDFYRYTIGKRSGRDYQTLALDIMDSLVDEFTDIGAYVELSSTNSGNAADTYKGQSVTRQVSVEGVEDGDGGLDLTDIYLGVDYRWKGWTGSREKIESIYAEIQKKFGKEIFPKESLIGVKEVQFYSVDLTVALYEAGVKHLLDYNANDIRLIYHRYSLINPYNKFFQQTIDRVQSKLLKAQELKKKGKTKQLAKKLAELLNEFEGGLQFEGFLEIVGGKKNVFVQGKLNGFRTGVEYGDRGVYAHTLGRIGSEKPQGPLRYLQAQTGISEGELLVYWLLNRF